MLKLYSVDMAFANAGVITNSTGIITKTAPILRKFIGQSINSLKSWKPVRSLVLAEEFEDD